MVTIHCGKNSEQILYLCVFSVRASGGYRKHKGYVQCTTPHIAVVCRMEFILMWLWLLDDVDIGTTSVKYNY
jgi:hypothetical protein